jgi:tetratricopeptide (TPR) repeat protein
MKSVCLVLCFLLSVAGGYGQGASGDRERELAQAVELTAQLVELFKAGRNNEALPVAQKVVEIRQRLASRDDPLLGAAYTNLGEIYFALEKNKEAEESFKQALAVYEAKSESNAGLIGKTLDRLGYLRFLKRDYKTAEALYLQSVEIKDKKLGETNPETIQSLKNYACASFLAGGNKKDDFQSKGRLRARATCWLAGFKDDCGKGGETDSDVLNGRALKLAQPPYSAGAREKRLSGKVLIAILIDEAGNVSKARPVCGGHPELTAGSLQSAYASKFSPTNVNGQPVQVSGVLVYNFVIR